jgi:protein-disulfide isomerase
MSLHTSSSRLAVPVSAHDHVIGPPDAPVTMVEYGDYECPYCGEAQPVVEALLNRLGDSIRFAFRHFPLSMVHPHAQHAAEAAEAAGAQGQFWQMHELLFANQDSLDDASLVQYAQSLDLDVEQFVSELQAHAHAARVREYFVSGVRSGVNGTPTFFINGFRHNGGFDFGSLLEAMELAAAHEA